MLDFGGDVTAIVLGGPVYAIRSPTRRAATIASSRSNGVAIALDEGPYSEISATPNPH